ncbi:heme oxygenase-like domain-containing protein [Roseivivax sp. CAU 1761]
MFDDRSLPASRPLAPRDRQARGTRGFRWRLKQDTDAAHAAAEAAVAPLVDGDTPDIPGFVAAQGAALKALQLCLAGAAEDAEGQYLRDLIAAHEADGHAFRHPVPAPRNADVTLDADAVAYLVLGSRLGAQVLTRRLQGAGHDVPASLALPAPAGAWPALCLRLDAIDPASARAGTILRDTRRGFEIFRAAAARIQLERGTEPK